MWFYGVFIAVIVGCIIGAIVIVARKFPQVTLIDTESLPMEREAKKKKEILQQRVARQSAAWWQKRLGKVVPYVWQVRHRFRAMYGKMLVLDSHYTKPKELTREDIEEKVDVLLREAERCRDEGRTDDVEKAYVKVITLDQKNAKAYDGLGDLYLETKQYEQAREMFGFLVRLGVRNCLFRRLDRKERRDMPFRAAMAHDTECPVAADIHDEVAKYYAKYGKTFEAKGDMAGARLAYEQAVCFQPSNPRYLDLLLEACILELDRKRAEEVLAAMREANPENQKFTSFEERIAEIGVKERG